MDLGDIALQDDEPERPPRADRSRRLHLPFPGRQCLGGAGLRARHDPDGAARLRHGRPGAASRSTMPSSTMPPIRCGCGSMLRSCASSMTARPRARASVTVTYVEDGKLKTVQAGHVVLACWHRVIPHITDEVGDAAGRGAERPGQGAADLRQRAARNWEAFDKLKIAGFTTPKGFWNGAEIDFPVSVGNYKFADKPSDPGAAAPGASCRWTANPACRPASRRRPGAIALVDTHLRGRWSARSATCSAAR